MAQKNSSLSIERKCSLIDVSDLDFSVSEQCRLLNLESSFCPEMLEGTLSIGNPAIFNTDQGVQFTSNAWTGAVEGAGVRVSMDGKGRCFDNIFVERLWQTVKYEDVSLRGYSTPTELREGLKNYFRFYNERRPHQSLGNKSPLEFHRMNSQSVAWKAGA